MTSVLKKVINIYQNWCNQKLWSLFGQFPNFGMKYDFRQNMADVTKILPGGRVGGDYPI